METKPKREHALTLFKKSHDNRNGLFHLLCAWFLIASMFVLTDSFIFKTVGVISFISIALLFRFVRRVEKKTLLYVLIVEGILLVSMLFNIMKGGL